MTDPELVQATVSRYILKRLIVEASPVGGLQLTIARIPKKLRAQGVQDTFYGPDPSPRLSDPDDRNSKKYSYDCENPDHPSYAGPWTGSEVVEPPPSPPGSPEPAVRYDNTVPTPEPSPRSPAGSASASYVESDLLSLAPAPAPAPAPGERNASPP